MTEKVRHVLLAEDDYLQAQDIMRFIRGTGSGVLGPVNSVEKGMSLVAQADAAVLDIDLAGTRVFPLADALMERDVPCIFYTGMTGEVDVPRRFWRVPLIRKPIQTLSDAAIVALTAFPSGGETDIDVVLPKLRLAARLVYGDATVADRLVERLLKDAIAHVSAGRTMGQGSDKTEWLMHRMREILRAQRGNLMN